MAFPNLLPLLGRDVEHDELVRVAGSPVNAEVDRFGRAVPVMDPLTSTKRISLAGAPVGR